MRAVNGPGCQQVRHCTAGFPLLHCVQVRPTGEAECEFVWLMDCDYKVELTG